MIRNNHLKLGKALIITGFILGGLVMVQRVSATSTSSSSSTVMTPGSSSSGVMAFPKMAYTTSIGKTITVVAPVIQDMAVRNFSFTLNGETVTNVSGKYTATKSGIVTVQYGYTESKVSGSVSSGQFSVVTQYIKVQDNEMPVYRLYNKVSMAHLYTTDLNEKTTLPTLDKNWTYEGISWQAATSGTSVYRLYNPTTGEHLYTKDTNEVSVLTTTAGWTKEGTAFYSSTAEDSATSIHRLYNPAAGVGSHLITMDANEASVLQTRGWKNEGIAWYAAFE